MRVVPPKPPPQTAEEGLSDADREALRERIRAREERRAAELDERAATPDEDQPPPDLLEALRQLGTTGRAGLGAAGEAAKSMRSLVSADISLARSALGRTLAFTGVAIAFGASSWLLLMATLIVVLSRELGWAWSTSLLATAALSVIVTWFAGWQAMRYFEHTRMQATRRQLARLGIGELADYTPEPGSVESARSATRHRPPEDERGRPAKDDLGVDVTPP